MSVLADLEARGYWVKIQGEKAILTGQAPAPPPELLAEARRVKPALIVEVLLAKERELRAFIDSEAPLAERLARVPEYSRLLDEIGAAREELLACWRPAGFTILWSALVEEFILVGEGSPHLGARAIQSTAGKRRRCSGTQVMSG